MKRSRCRQSIVKVGPKPESNVVDAREFLFT